MGERFAIAIIGAGPAGLSAAARAAETGVSHVLLESAADIADTVRHFQKGKLVMAEPVRLPLRAAVGFAAGARESVLETWRQDVARHRIHLRTGARVTAIGGQKGGFRLQLAGGEQVEADHVVLAIGLQGNIRTLDVPGADLPGIQYGLADPDEYRGETIVVIGGGDAGVEDALALSAGNRVVLINRQDEFTSCREANFNRLHEAVAGGRIETRVGSSAVRVERDASGEFPLSLTVQSPRGMEHLPCHRIIVRIGATPPRPMLEGFGIRFPSGEPTALPQLTERYESNVPGLYIVGALAGYPLIKQALNQGFEVVESILGREVEPADQGLLLDKLSRIPGLASVAAGIDLLRDTLPLFASLTRLQLREFMLDSEVNAPHAGEVIFRRNDYSNSFFSTLRGTVEIHVEREDGTTAMFPLPAGEFFGEIGLLSGRRRSATVVAGEDCVVIETPRRSMLRLLDSAPGVQARLDEVSLKRIVRSFCGTPLPEDDLEHLVQEASIRRYATGDTLFNEGDEADALYVIRRGSVTVSRQVDGKEKVLAYVSAGNYIGEMALVSKKPRTATVRAAAPTETVTIEAARFNAVLERNTAVRREVAGRYLDRIRSDEADAARDPELVEFLMGQGIGEATDVLLIDTLRCIRCNNCEQACAEVHDGFSRLSRAAGKSNGHLQVPASCRHCEHPACMKDCAPDAIHRLPGGEVFIDDRCIGCGNCEQACPYGVIRLEARVAYRPTGLLQLLFGRRGTASELRTGDAEASKRAVKCDMCHEIIGGAACVRACPTGAAFRVNPERYLAVNNR